MHHKVVVIPATTYILPYIQTQCKHFIQIFNRFLSLLHQEQVLFPDLSVCKKYLDVLGYQPDLDAPILSLNTMGRLVVQLCCILICDPKVIILDEPSAGRNFTRMLLQNILKA